MALMCLVHYVATRRASSSLEPDSSRRSSDDNTGKGAGCGNVPAYIIGLVQVVVEAEVSQDSTAAGVVNDW